MLIDEFPDLDGEAVTLVWHWKSPGRTAGLSSENLDALLLRIFESSGYDLRR